MKKVIKEKIEINGKLLPECPIETVLTLLDSKWKFVIIRELLEGEKRFCVLKKDTGASQKSLTLKLREMENDGLVERRVYGEIPPRVEYGLSDIGYSLALVLDAMAGWGTDYKKFCSLKNKINSSL